MIALSYIIQRARSSRDSRPKFDLLDVLVDPCIHEEKILAAPEPPVRGFVLLLFLEEVVDGRKLDEPVPQRTLPARDSGTVCASSRIRDPAADEKSFGLRPKSCGFERDFNFPTPDNPSRFLCLV